MHILIVMGINVLFDLLSTQPDALSKRHGGGKYGEVIFKRIAERHLPMACYYDSSRWLNPDIQHIIEDNAIELYDRQQHSLDEIVSMARADVVYTCQYTRELTKLTHTCIIGTIHGLRGLETPWDYDMVNYLPLKNTIKYYLYKIWRHGRTKREDELLSAIFSNPLCKVVTVSHHSASSIKCYLPQYGHRNIPVFYSPSTSATTEISRKYMDRYFLLVSANRSYKNALRAIRAFDRLFSNGYFFMF